MKTRILNIRNILVTILILSIALIGGCSKDSKKLDDTVNVKLVTPAGGPTLAVLSMLEQDLLGEYNIELDFEMVSATNSLSADLISETIDIAIIPTNLAANLYNQGVDYKIGGVAIWGNLYLIANEEMSLQDIKGKEITTFGQGLTPDIIFNYLLEENGIDPTKDVKLNYLAGVSAVAPMFISGQTDIALVAEPMLSTIKMKKPDTKIVLDLQKEWANIPTNGQSYPQAVVVINSKFVDNQQKAVELILDELNNSIKFANENPQELGDLAEKYEIGLTRDVVAGSIVGMNINYVSAKDAKDTIIKYLNILKDFNEKSVGGKLPDETIYMD